MGYSDNFFRSAAIKSAQKYPRAYRVASYIVFLLLGMYLTVSIADPLTTPKSMFFACVFALLLVGVLVALSTKGKTPGLFIVFVLLAGWLVLLNHQFKQYLPLKDEVLIQMNKNQKFATSCVQKEENLSKIRPSSNRGRIFRDKDVPISGKSLCPLIGSWAYLPQGWAYNPALVEDLTASDGTFKFSARSRWQESITCTELGCEYEGSN